MYTAVKKKERENQGLECAQQNGRIDGFIKEQQEVYIYKSYPQLFRQNCPYRRSLPVSKMCRPYSFILGLFSDGLVTQDYAVLNGHLIPK